MGQRERETQARVDEDGRSQARRWARVDRLWNEESAGKGNEIEQGSYAERVREESVEEGESSLPM
jgi:hypothetical protein